MNAYLIQITGKVVNVGFRSYAQEKAYRFGIKGYVQYTGKDSLIIAAEGEEEQLKKFVSFCKKGNIWSHIKNVSVEETSVTNYSAFDIRHSHHHKRPK